MPETNRCWSDDFGGALSALQSGCRVQRSGWNGKGMFLFMIWNWQAIPFDTGNGYMRAVDSTAEQHPTLPFIAMKTADDKIVPWLASQTDILAHDWKVLTDPEVVG